MLESGRNVLSPVGVMYAWCTRQDGGERARSQKGGVGRGGRGVSEGARDEGPRRRGGQKAA
jgi:hypothetical protein